MKDLDDNTSSIDVSSNEESGSVQEDTQVPAIVVSGDVGATLRTMETLDDVDEDEAFISELMAMHPNDEEIRVEDLEGDGDLLTIQEGLRTTEGVETPEIILIPEDLITPEPPQDNDEDGDGVRKCFPVVAAGCLLSSLCTLVLREICQFPNYFMIFSFTQFYFYAFYARKTT